MRTYLKAAALLCIVIALAACQDRKQQAPKGGPGAMAPAPFITPEQIKQLENAANMAPNNPQGWAALGNALMDSGRFAEAAAAYEKSLKIDPKNIGVRVDMGTCYKNSGQPERALEEFRKALKIDPKHMFAANAHRNAGLTLAFDLNRPAEAARELERFLELQPNAPDAGQVRQLIQDLKSRPGRK